ncbi:MAG: hypothetical protein E6Q76_15705 [Rhizobium sp.]|nr:MAG: hypothetical protein E6Q76_15705 [Rhizobium sp.]
MTLFPPIFAPRALRPQLRAGVHVVGVVATERRRHENGELVRLEVVVVPAAVHVRQHRANLLVPDVRRYLRPLVEHHAVEVHAAQALFRGVGAVEADLRPATLARGQFDGQLALGVLDGRYLGREVLEVRPGDEPGHVIGRR